MAIVVDDRMFVVGLCELSRQQLKAYEVSTLLPLAVSACRALNLTPAAVPIEGYYSESQDLERLFRLVRALQSAEMRTLPQGAGEQAIDRLRRVFTSPAMGRTEESDRVIPRTSSPFGQALRDSTTWSVDSLARQARDLVRTSDAGLVAVASVTADPIALCVARESVALAGGVELAAVEQADFVWAVSDAVAAVAARFVTSLAEATGITLPEPRAASSAVYGYFAQDADIIGRCILVGEQPGTAHPFYHWYIEANGATPAVNDFWSSTIWSTSDMRRLPSRSRPVCGARVGAPAVDEIGGRRARAGGFTEWLSKWRR